MRYLDKEQQKKIGYDYVLEKLQILSPYGKKRLKSLKPYRRGEEEQLASEHQRMEVIMELIGEKYPLSKIELLLMKLRDIHSTFTACSKGEILDEIQLYEVKNQCMIVRDIQKEMEEYPISDIKFKNCNRAIDLLDPKNEGMPTFHIYGYYSEKLQLLREEKKKLEKSIYKSDSLKEAELLRSKRLEVVTLENEEELVVKKILSKKLIVFMEDMIFNAELLGKLDLLIAKGKLTDRYKLKKPTISMNQRIEAKGIYNLEIKDIVEKSNHDYTPIDVVLDKGTTIITGANMGGKTVALKTITLNVFLFQMGFYPMGEDVAMPLFDFIEFISDDMQDVSKGLSTFGAEMIKLKEIMVFLHRGEGFIALDEFARGTNPYEGQKMAKSLGEYLHSFGSISLMATHYDGVIGNGMNHYQVVGLKNVDFDSLKRKIDLTKKDSIGILQKYMDYRLEKCKGCKVPKDALNIAMLLGVQEDLTRYILRNYKEES